MEKDKKTEDNSRVLAMVLAVFLFIPVVYLFLWTVVWSVYWFNKLFPWPSV